MTRPLGYSVERQDDGRIALASPYGCARCEGFGAVGCPGCGGTGIGSRRVLFEVEAARALRDALTAALGETSERAHIAAFLRMYRDQYSDHAKLWNDHHVIASKSEQVASALHNLASVIERAADRDRAGWPKTSLDAAREARDRAAVSEAPAAPVASEGPAKGAGSSTLADLYDDVPSNIADGDR